MLLQIVKELEAKNHFLYIDKSHNCDGNLPMKAAKRDIVGWLVGWLFWV